MVNISVIWSRIDIISNIFFLDLRKPTLDRVSFFVGLVAKLIVYETP